MFKISKMSDKIYIRINKNKFRKLTKDIRDYEILFIENEICIIGNNRGLCFKNSSDFMISSDLNTIEKLETFNKLSKEFIGRSSTIKLTRCLYNDIFYYPLDMINGDSFIYFVLIKSENQNIEEINELKESIKNENY